VGIDFRKIRVGDQFRAGEVELAITKLRKPCQTLDGIKRGIQKELYHATLGAANWGRGGFYAKIVTPGTIVKNDIIAKAGP